MKTKIGTLALVQYGALMAAMQVTLTACQSSALPQPQPLLAHTQKESALLQKEQKERTDATAALAPVAGVSAPQAAASGPAAAKRDYAVRWLRPLQGRDKNDDVEAIYHGWQRGIQLIVTSKSGAGEVEVQPTNAFWPRHVQLQFQYASGKPFNELERLYVQVDPDAWPGDRQTDLYPMNNFVVWQRDGVMRVDLPAGWLHDQQVLHMAWADHLSSSLVLPNPPKTPAAK